jgi:hypothetical protein
MRKRAGNTLRQSLCLLASTSAILLAAAAPAGATPSAAHKTFYLDLKAGQCAEGAPAAKTLLVVSCSDGRHNFEVFAVLHGGWAHGRIPPHDAAFAIARDRCNSTFQRRYRHPIRAAGYGWYAFWADPGKEEAKYGDRIVCSLTRYPGQPPMGLGIHFGQAG